MIDLLQRLAGCTGGETIELGDDTVAPFYARDVTFDSSVTIRGGLWKAPNDTRRTFRFDRSRNIVFDGIEVVGEDRSADGFLFQHCENITVRNAWFHGLKNGIRHDICTGMTFEDIDFRNIRKDAIGGGGASRFRARRIYGTDFYPVNTGGKGDHPDLLQFWPEAKSDNDDILVEDCTFERGAGLPIQVVFVRGLYDPKMDRPEFGRVSVKGCRAVDALINAIAVSGASGGEVVDNVIIATTSENEGALRIKDYGGVVDGNVAPRFIEEVPADTNRIVAWDDRPTEIEDDHPEAPPSEPVPPEPEPAPLHAPEEAMPAEVLRARLQKTRDEVNGMVNFGRRGLYQLDQLLASLDGRTEG
ncbi:right-handed parallel beta-helix repeat-containing protein [Erythrobacter sp. LQ02-29]|uniref:right-handed parallel beta-helix repeat-containing protein n=1 Tax=Erythrobacter sp. LQ02-29 TaxID=2920384 RepID=UPI001F4DACC4|nr:right-handed parallel beta-helix repeat-containing protein [Erythrobacter sp. LQ02-29]MCP9222759.1 right-handed parallel beta-helix repeat-containing protein [Erythrobacter sp. LQ02-29]